MSSKLNEDFLFLIFSIIEEIPEGKVATYGQIAALAGYKKNSRLVGKAVGISQLYGDYPCFRMVNSQGRCAPNWPEQRELLENDGVTFKENGCVDLKKHQWKI